MLIAALTSLLTTVPTATAQVEIDANDTKTPISRNLFAKFTEHLGRNVYLGMWSQIVLNGEFAPRDRWMNPENVDRALQGEAELYKLPNLPDAPNHGIAAHWSPSDGLTGELVKQGIHDVQNVTVGERGGALRTGIFPPFHRVREVEITLTASSAPAANVTGRIETVDGKPVATATLAFEEAESTQTATLTAPDSTYAPGTPYRLVLAFQPNTKTAVRRVLLFPSDHVEGWEPDVVRYMKDARLPMLRFPGGNFVSGYHWEDGIGSLDNRPTLPNPAWGGTLEPNHVGTGEWLRLCELTGAEPLICVNAGDGSPEEARRWVEYCNGSTNTPMGKQRAGNGHPEPYHVRYWEIGNELWGRWQIGHTDAHGNAKRYGEFLSVMREEDPSILFIANGGSAEWNRILVNEATEPVRSLAEHTLPGSHIPNDADPEVVFREFMAHTDAYDDTIRELVAPMVEAGLTPLLAITELQVFTNKPDLPNNSSLTDALWTAGIIHAAIRTDGLVEMITHSAMMNHAGGLRKERGIVFTNPVWWTTHLYADQNGVIPTGRTVTAPTFSTEGKWLTKREGMLYLDVEALLSEDGATLSVFVVNRHPSESMETTFTLNGFEAGAATVDTVTGDSYMARNRWDATELVVPKTEMVEMGGASLARMLPPHSLTRFLFSRKP